jgi:hypothetical protein
VPDTRKAPPPWLLNGIGRVRAGLDLASRSAVPANIALLEMAQGAGLFQSLLETNPEYARAFNGGMTGVSAMSIDAAVPLYDFTDRRLIVDVGGGHGALLAAVLAQSPTAQGVLFDLPSVVEGAGRALDAAGVTQRCTVTAGSFFDSVPNGGDAYLLKSIIHDWDDASALTILRNVRAAIAADGKLLLLELVLPKRGAATFGHAARHRDAGECGWPRTHRTRVRGSIAARGFPADAGDSDRRSVVDRRSRPRLARPHHV